MCLSACVGARGEEPQARIFVDASHVIGHAPPHLSGHFFEVMHDSVIGGIWAEKLLDRSFEKRDGNGDGVPDDWRPVGDATFAIDDETAVPQREKGREHSLRIAAKGAAGVEHPGLVLRKGEKYDVSLWLKQSGLAGPVTVALKGADGTVHAHHEFAGITGKWARCECRLDPARDDDAAAFSISCAGPGTLWVDKASVVPDTAVHEFRADVVAAIKALRPTVIRFPGGNFTQGYHWTDGIGPRDLRPTTFNAAWGNASEGNEMGTDEFMALCREVGAQPMICFGIGDTGSARAIPDNSTERAFRDALAWLEYCNGDASTEWGRRRASNGHREPYRVKYWEVGNELFGEWEIGHADAWTYARRFREFAKALRAKDPSIEIIACGADAEWNRTLLEVAPEEVDWLALHHYFRSGSFADCAAEPTNFARFIDETRAMAERMRPGKPLRISLNEWNTSFGPEMNHSLMAGIWGAALMNEMIRRGDTVQMLNVSDLVNGWNGGVIQAHARGLFVTPDYEVIRAHAENHGAPRVKTSVRCPTFDSPSQGRGHPALDVVATRGERGDRLYLSVVNKSLEPIEAGITLDGCKVTRAPQIWTLTAAEVAAYNSAEHQDVTLSASEGSPPGFLASLRMTEGGQFTFPGPSFTILSVPIESEKTSAMSRIEGRVDAPGALVWAEDGETRIETRAGAEGEYTLAVSPGLWRVSATARDREVAVAETVEVTARRPGRADFTLGRPLTLAGAEGTDFEGTALPEIATPTYLAGSRGGTWRVEDGALVLKGGRDTRFGLLSAPIPWSTQQATVVEAKIERYTGTNALLDLYGGSGAGDFSHFCEVGVEHGRAQVWAANAPVTGEETQAPAVLRMVAGPPRADGRRSVDFYVNGRLLQRIPSYGDLGAGPLRIFIYGWGESETVWDWVRAYPAESAALEATVRDADGKPLEGVLVDALGIAGARTDAQGRCRLEGMPEGPVRVVVDGGEFGLVERETTLAASQVTAADFVVARAPRQGALLDDFAALDASRWTIRALGAGTASARVEDGQLALDSPRGSAIVVESQPIPGSAAGVSVAARITHFVGEAVTLHVGALSWSLRDGSLQASDGRRIWWPPEGPLSMPCDLKVVVSAPDAQGRRSAAFWYNGALRHTFEGIESLPAGEDFRVALGGGNCAAKWDWVAVTLSP